MQKNVYGASVIIFEGIMSFADKELLEVRLFFFLFEGFFSHTTQLKWLQHLFLPLQLLDMKIFVDTDSDIRLVRRLRRDITERGRDIEGVIKQYNKFVKPAFEQYIEPTMRLADIVVPRGETAGAPSPLIHSLFLVQSLWGCATSSANAQGSSLGGGNMVAIDLIVQHVHSQLEEVSYWTLTVWERMAPPCVRNRELLLHQLCLFLLPVVLF